jgi:hypothetical protein
MPELTRRRSVADRDSWGVWYDDVRVGAISRRSGNPRDTAAWRWDCGFYPGPDLRQAGGNAASLEEAQDAFRTAWGSYLSRCTPLDFQKYRDWQEHRAAIDAAHARGEKLPTEFPSSMMTCACGARFDSHKPADNAVHLPHVYAAKAASGR